MKKLISLLVTVCMVFALTPMAVLAAPLDQDADAAVTADPQITVLDGSVLDDAEEDIAEYYDADQAEEDGIIFEAQNGNWQQEGSNWVYLQEDGTTAKGLVRFANNAYYCDLTTGYLLTGWITDAVQGTVYYGDAAPGVPGDPGSNFGVLKSGKQTLLDPNGNQATYYFNPTTYIRMGGWVKIGSDKYYFNPSNGKMKTGWLKLNGDKYYLGTNGKMVTGKKKIDGNTYYFNTTNGKMQTGWQTIDGSRYHFASSGKMQTGWVKVNGYKYYFASSGKMVTGKHKIKGSTYYFDTSSGKMKTGAVKISGTLYYFYSSGKAVSKKGWFKGSDKKSRYCYSAPGKVYTGQHKIGSMYYVFDKKTGVCTRNLGDDTDRKVQSYSSGTSKLIYVNKSNYTLRVYSGKKGSWSRIYTFTCAVGKSSSPTPGGTFRISSKVAKHPYKTKDSSGNTVQVHYNNLSHFGSGNMGINGPVYLNADDGPLFDGDLGGRYTGGNVRLSDGNAQWIYNNCGIGTTVVIR